MSPQRIVAVVLLLISIVATGMLVFQHFAGAAIPGCAPGGACAQAAASAWGRLPGTNIPVSILGLAYYIAVLLAYIHARGDIGLLKWVVRIGVLGSLFYTIVMFANIGDYFCQYCIIGHLGHFGFWGIMELTTCSAPASMTPVPQPAGPLAVALGAFVLIAGGLVGANAMHQRDIDRAAQRDFDESMRQIGEGGGRAFTGRYVRGPEMAAARVVMFTDYQCSQCKVVKDEMRAILAERDDVSFSIKHYPLDASCNRYIDRTLHANACWAARVVEAAGILGGEEGYWRMHDWVVDRGGQFSDAVLEYSLPQLGFNFNRFMTVVRSQETLDRVRADIEEAMEVGVFGTPLVFLNGVELRGRRAPNALAQAVASAAEAGAGEGSPVEDRPPSAFEKHIDDWVHGMQAELASIGPARSLGAAEPRVVIDAWGDFHDPNIANFHAAARGILARRDDVQYNFRYFPMDPSCNEHAPGMVNPNGCRAARAAEAASRLGGAEGYAKMLDFLFRARGRFTDHSLQAAVMEMGFDANRFIGIMLSEEVGEVIKTEAAGAQAVGIRWLPHVFVNNRHLPRWRLEGHDVLGAVVEEASKLAD